MKEIKAHINCRENTCYKCGLVQYGVHHGIPDAFVCLLFDKEVKVKGGSYVRLPECKAAEEKDMYLREIPFEGGKYGNRKIRL